MRFSEWTQEQLKAFVSHHTGTPVDQIMRVDVVDVGLRTDLNVQLFGKAEKVELSITV